MGLVTRSRIHRQLRHRNLGITRLPTFHALRHGGVYAQGIDTPEMIETVLARRVPMIPVTGSLRP